jgi:hypothetical protein
MRGKLLITFAAALLASTALAIGQGATERRDQGPGTSQPGATQGQPKSKGAQGAQKGQQRPSTSGQAQENRQQGPTQREQGPPRTQGQNQREQGPPRTQGQAPRNQGETRTPSQAQPAPNQPGRTQGQAQPRGGTTLTSEQRTKIRQTVIEGRNAPRVNRVDFSLNVGTVIPRTVRIVEVPETIVEIHPEWRRYRYFVYNNEIVIVEPDTLRIVAVLEV